MPAKIEILGQITQLQIRGIDILAIIVHQAVHLVEVSSLFGAIFWAWAKIDYRSATVNRIDPWGKYISVRPIEERTGIAFKLDRFLAYTKKCDNIEHLQHYILNGYQKKLQPLDLCYEDVIHTDPLLSCNLNFWAEHIKPKDIICGDDYSGRFPNIRAEAERKDGEEGQELIFIEHFWYLLLIPKFSARHTEVRLALMEMAQEYHDEIEASGPHAVWGLDQNIEPLDNGKNSISSAITQSHTIPWSQETTLRELTACLGFFDVNSDNKVLQMAGEFITPVLEPDLTCNFFVLGNIADLARMDGNVSTAELNQSSKLNKESMALSDHEWRVRFADNSIENESVA